MFKMRQYRVPAKTYGKPLEFLAEAVDMVVFPQIITKMNAQVLQELNLGYLRVSSA